MGTSTATKSDSYLVPAFRLVAHAEALSWAGLLVGMAFKYLVQGNAELGEQLVSVFGAVHGGLVMIYVALAWLVGRSLHWGVQDQALAIASAVPPFATVVFDWLARRQRMYRRAAE